MVAGGRESTATSGGWPGGEHVASDGAAGAPDDSQTTAGISDRASTWPTTTAAAPTVRIHAMTNPSTSSVRALAIKKSVQRGRGRGRTVERALDGSCTARAGGRISRVNVGRTRSRELAPSEKGAGPGTGDGPGRLKNGWAAEGEVIGTTSFGSGRGKDRSRDVSRSPSTSGSGGGTGMRDRTGARDGAGVRSAFDARDGTGVRSALDARVGPGVRNALDARDGIGVRTAEAERVERGSGGGVVRAVRRGDDPLSPSARSALARLTTRCAMRSPTT